MPKWPFLAGDALLLGLALVIGCYAHNPFAGKPLILIVACVALGAVLGTWPFIADYESKRNEALDERQRGLEALAHTITSSAEQISIAAQSLPGMAEAATKSLKLAEQLPARFQEKMGEVKQGLAEVSAARKESSAVEHAAESERLAATADHLRQAVTELAKFESSAQKSLAAAGDKLDAKAAQIFKQLDAKIVVLSALAEKFSANAAPRPEEKPAPVRARARKEPETLPARGELAEPVERAEPARGEPAHPELVERVESTPDVAEKPASIEPSHDERASPEPARGEPVESAERVEPIAIEASTEESKAPRKRAPKKSKGEDAEPSLDFDASAKSTDSPPAAPAPTSSTVGDESSPPSPDEAAPATAVSADGATRLLVTAYIGIGNKIFLRGDGPGLSWDEGVPLQFVSIGKWRWETTDATVPVHAKLYKNDEVVCAALGKFTLDPGQQAEVTAAF
jgi:hypothetical protein